MTIYFEDLKVGRRFVSEKLKVSREEIVEFAQRYDPQPFHLDEAAARDSFFGSLVASGWLTAALTMRLLVTGPTQLAGGIIGAGGEVEWLNPVRPNDELYVESEIMDARESRSRKDRGIVTMRSETKNQHGEVVQRLISKVVVGRRPDPVP